MLGRDLIRTCYFASHGHTGVMERPEVGGDDEGSLCRLSRAQGSARVTGTMFKGQRKEKNSKGETCPVR